MKKSTHRIAYFSVISLMIIVLWGCDQSPPTIVTGEFPFRFTYELKGSIYNIEDTIICEYSDWILLVNLVNGWEEHPKSGTDRISKPHVCYVETFDISLNEKQINATPLTDKQLQEYFGIKIINFTFTTPIDNTFK